MAILAYMTAPKSKDTPDGADPFFRGNGNITWNACIGRQGEEENYVSGYIEAALLLVETLIRQKLLVQRDTLIFPILFNARHAIELNLKMIIRRLVSVGVINQQARRDHDILWHWRLLEESNLGDLALRNLVLELGPYVESLSRLDRDGQELRYHERDGKQSLSNYSIVNLITVANSLNQLNRILSDLGFRVHSLGGERATKSFTKFCSRRDLFEIAEMLPPISDWKDARFDRAKEAVRARYNISSRQFSRAINIIKHNREMSGMLGKEWPLLHISDTNALFVVNQWLLLHPPRTKDNNGASLFKPASFFLEMDNEINRGELYDAIFERLDKNELADMEVIFYFGRDRQFSEFYEAAVEKTKNRYLQCDNEALLMHILEKGNFLKDFSKGVSMLGHSTLAQALQEIQQNRERQERELEATQEASKGELDAIIQEAEDRLAAYDRGEIASITLEEMIAARKPG
jgi:hypothetical protein